MNNLFDWFKALGGGGELKSDLDVNNLDLLYEDEDLISTTDFEKFDSVRIAYSGGK